MPKPTLRQPGRRRTTDVAELDEEDDLSGPLRRCAATRARLPKSMMVRFVVGPDARIVPDLANRLPGRGIWLSARADVLEPRQAKGGLQAIFSRAAKTSVTVDPDLASALSGGLLRRVIDTIGLARRAGQAVSGFEKAGAWVRGGRAGLIVQAADGSPAERARFVGGFRGPVVTPLDAAMLGSVFGRDHVVHAAVLPGRLAEMIAMEAARLAGIRGDAEIDVRKIAAESAAQERGSSSTNE